MELNGKKIALIAKGDPSAWKSCQAITGNLEKVYRRVFAKSQLEIILVSQNFNHYNAYSLASRLRQEKFDCIAWVDHKPNAALLVDALDEVFSDVSFDRRPKFAVHLFGDFVLDCLGWREAAGAISRWPLHFFVASKKQQELVEKFFIGKNDFVSVMPFAVDATQFNFDSTSVLSQTFRQEFNFKSSDTLLLYTGRLSYQKNIESLVKTFSSIGPLLPENTHLLIAGEWDDILMPYSGKFGPLGSYFAQFSGTSEKFLNEHIHFLGKLNSAQLQKAYNGSDLFVSFSTYNDEDFGMSVAEALCCGLPCLLSNWGGFSSFADYTQAVELVPVVYGSSRPQVHLELARKWLLKSLHQLPQNKTSASVMSQKALAHLSVEAVADKLAAQWQTPCFHSVDQLSEVFLKLCVMNEMNPGSPFKKGKKQELAEFYKVIYGGYGA